MTIPAPSFTSGPVAQYDVLRSPPSLGAVLRRARTGIKLEQFVLVYEPGQLNQARAQQLIDEWDAAAGSAGTFMWTPPPPWSAGAVEVRFAEDTLPFDVASIVAYGITVTLVKEPS